MINNRERAAYSFLRSSYLQFSRILSSHSRFAAMIGWRQKAIASFMDLFCSSMELNKQLSELTGAVRHGVGKGVVSPDGIALSLAIAGREGQRPLLGHYRGSALIYPASVVKSFFMAAVFAWLEAGRLAPTVELKRALEEMIGASSNDATHYVVDLLTGTTAGPELPEERLSLWLGKRRAVQDWLESLGWPEWRGCVALQKTFEDGPFGREAQARRLPASRNALSTNVVARLMWEIAQGMMVSKAASRAMLHLLRRDRGSRLAGRHPGDQVSGFFAEGLPRSCRIHSKAGWTSRTRHDSAIVDTGKSGRFVLVAFTEGRKAAASESILPDIARRAFRLAKAWS